LKLLNFIFDCSFFGAEKHKLVENCSNLAGTSMKLLTSMHKIP